ncbi:vacuolar membrane protein-domain-containing protein [Fimicolochytrium jonesii]|uniref:vacuolar membrane protein-domain-containing protein n=1 Tax=Fimicolochytrium jonesii TaxID=1396493 RepID=UPI0022FEF1ED|nr:vacuolar membrane protein-domain-containing protein [Fimicolochytrium jonesii]KAI8816916.1 vacuolar membrane protein-domain-containing protein [Fimicolochytrium jonesii]
MYRPHIPRSIPGLLDGGGREGGAHPPEPFKCQLLDGFAILVQILMASIALSSLIIKRNRETPQRPFKIWALDTSKQAVAAGLVHFANIAIASFTGGESENSDNPCVWYFLHILLDTTLGVGILALFLRLLHQLADKFHMSDMRSGYYGYPPRIRAWAKQLLLFLIAWFFVKLTVVAILTLFPFLATVAGWILNPLVSGDTDPRLQVLVVMLIFPLCMNVVQAWLIDMVIKGKHPHPHHHLNRRSSSRRNLAGSYRRVGDQASTDDLGGGGGLADSTVDIHDSDSDNANMEDSANPYLHDDEDDDDSGGDPLHTYHTASDSESLLDDIDEHLGADAVRMSATTDSPKGSAAGSGRSGRSGTTSPALGRNVTERAGRSSPLGMGGGN